MMIGLDCHLRLRKKNEEHMDVIMLSICSSKVNNAKYLNYHL